MGNSGGIKMNKRLSQHLRESAIELRTQLHGQLNLSGIKCNANIEAFVVCPDCNNTMICDLNEQHLSYPVIGDTDYLYFYCGVCEKEYELPIAIDNAVITISFNESDLQES